MTLLAEDEKEIVFMEAADNQETEDDNQETEDDVNDDDHRALPPAAASIEHPLRQGIKWQSSRHRAFFHNNDLGLQPGDEGFDEDQAALPFVLNEWATETTINGVAYIADGITWQWWKRALWLILVCCSGGLMLWQITRLIQEYNQREIISYTTIVTPISMKFPDITICSLGDNFKSLAKVLATGIEYPRNEKEVHAIAKSSEDLFPDTEFNSLDSEDLPQVWFPVITHLGLCWTFSTNETVVRPGQLGGLYFSVTLNQEENLTEDLLDDFSDDLLEELLDDGSSMALYAQQPGTPITDQLPFKMISPGSEAIVTLRKEEFHRQTENKWTQCYSKAPEYTQSTCRAACIYQEIQRQCACRELGDFTYDNETIPALDYCIHDDCTEKVWQNETEFLPSCPCWRPPCEEEKYSMTLDEAKSSSWNEYETTTVIVNFDEIAYTESTESIAISRSTLLSNIGGSMGLFLGISFISVVEVFGDLIPLRLLPRMFGYRNIHGVGARPAEEP